MDPNNKSTPRAPYNMRKCPTENQANAFQYHTPRGILVQQVVQATVQGAPNPSSRANGPTYPKYYRNEERLGRDTVALYNKTWETGRTDGRLYEYPVANPTIEPGAKAFDYGKRPANLAAVNEYNNKPLKSRLGRPLHPPKNPKELKHYNHNQPPNDPGPFRALADQNNNIKGVNYHPEGDSSGFRRAVMQPLDRKGRQQVNEHRTQSLFPARTWK